MPQPTLLVNHGRIGDRWTPQRAHCGKYASQHQQTTDYCADRRQQFAAYAIFQRFGSCWLPATARQHYPRGCLKPINFNSNNNHKQCGTILHNNKLNEWSKAWMCMSRHLNNKQNWRHLYRHNYTHYTLVDM